MAESSRPGIWELGKRQGSSPKSRRSANGEGFDTIGGPLAATLPIQKFGLKASGLGVQTASSLRETHE
jgi:hypothetical protein